jgi:hypothetical protein
MGDVRAGTPEMEGFVLGKPALVCRWRLHDRRLPLENRHLRALSRRLVGGQALSPEMVGWAKQHIEWTLDEGAAQHPDGVLMLIVDEERRAAMAVGEFEPLAHTSATNLAERAALSLAEARSTRVAPETLWLERDGELVVGIEQGTRPGGATDLILQLAETLGMPVARESDVAQGVLSGSSRYDECFLVSDEYGVVESRDAGGPRSRRFADSYQKLLDSTKRKY